MAKVTRIDDRWLCQPGKVGLGRTVARVMVRVLGLGRNKACQGGTVRGRERTTMAVAIVLGMLAGGCQDGGARQQEPVRAEWREVMLPAVPDGRATVGDVVSCGGRWYALGEI